MVTPSSQEGDSAWGEAGTTDEQAARPHQNSHGNVTLCFARVLYYRINKSEFWIPAMTPKLPSQILVEAIGVKQIFIVRSNISTLSSLIEKSDITFVLVKLN